MSLYNYAFEHSWARLAGVTLVELVLFDHIELHWQILEILTLLRVLWWLNRRLIRLSLQFISRAELESTWK